MDARTRRKEVAPPEKTIGADGNHRLCAGKIHGVQQRSLANHAMRSDAHRFPAIDLCVSANARPLTDMPPPILGHGLPALILSQPASTVFEEGLNHSVSD